MTLDSSDAICECSPEQSSPEGVDCVGQYGQMERVVAEEGNDVGSLVRTSSADDCQRECDANAACKSFTICPEWSKCWMKDRSLDGGESMSQQKDCLTYYKTCSSAPSPTDLLTQSPDSPTPSPTDSPTQSLPVVSGCTGSRCSGTSDRCDESSWPDKDHNLVCADCKVLVNHFSSKYQTCGGYCSHLGRRCVGAWEE